MTGGQRVSFFVPCRQRIVECLAMLLDAEVDDRGGAPNAAATVPEVKSSNVVVAPNGISMCVCGSTPPGIT